MSIAASIRQFFHDLFKNVELEKAEQRMQEYVLRRDADCERIRQTADRDMLMLRQDFERRLQDKDDSIADLKQEIAALRNKLDQYELVLIPLTNPIAGRLLNPKQENPTFEPFDSGSSYSSWQKTQEEFYKQQEVEAAAEAQRAGEETSTTEVTPHA